MEFLKKVRNAAVIGRLQQRARQDDGPRGYVDLCQALVVQGNPLRALSVAQEGVRRFPRSLELADQLRLVWGHAARGELRDLERKAAEAPDAQALAALAEHYLGVEELDHALRTAEQLASEHADSPLGPALVGRALWRRFIRDHVARDGMRALESLREAVAIDPAGFDSHLLLAEACFYVGSLVAASEAAASARALRPDDKDVAALEDAIAKANGTAPEGDEDALVQAVEERDGPFEGYKKVDPSAPDADTRGQATRLMHGVSQLPGVRILSLARGDYVLLAKDGSVFEEKRTPPEPMVELTSVFRGRIASCTRHLGIGAFQETEISLSNATVLAFGGLNAVLIVEVAPGTRTTLIAAACRDLMASLDRSSGGGTHA